MNIKLRLEDSQDYHIVEELTREAFWGLSQPACDEHFLVHKLRKASAFIPELDYVAETDGRIIGNVMYSKAKIINYNSQEYEVITFGPLSVLPEYQNMGVGKALMKHTISKARQLGYRAIVFFGEPDYYPRLGFKRAEEFNITTASGKNFDAFMAMPLFENALQGITGRFHEDPVFNIDPEQAMEYGKNFPYKEKRVQAPISVLLDKLDATAQKAVRGRDINKLNQLRNFSGREIASWQGIGKNAMIIINDTLKEHGYAAKIWP